MIAYTCQKCKSVVTTRNESVGVTPFMIQCRAANCDGFMASNFGKMISTDPAPTYEWYRASNVKDLTRDALDHHLKGGAFLRIIQPVRVSNKKLKSLLGK